MAIIYCGFQFRCAGLQKHHSCCLGLFFLGKMDPHKLGAGNMVLALR